MILALKANSLSFYLLFALTLGALLFTHPFLVYPFDVYTHLGWIDAQNLTNPTPPPRQTWHYIWASIFELFSVNRTDIFLRAYIIHYTQIITIFVTIFYVSRVILSILFYRIPNITLNYLAYWATLIWLSIFSTFSVHYQQVWIMWYSVNYQITLPLTLLVLALTLCLLFKPLSIVRKILYFLMVVSLSYLILKIHPMEYLYYLMYLGVLLLVYSDKIISMLRKNPLKSLGILTLLIMALIKLIPIMKSYSYRDSSLFHYLSSEKFPQLLGEIQKRGEIVTHHYNKASTTINELIILSLFLIGVFTLLLLYRRYRHQTLSVNLRMALFLGVGSLFILIPLFTYSAGFASLLTYNTVAYRFYYSALIFLVVPACLYYILMIFKLQRPLVLNIALFSLLALTLFYSKHFSKTANYYKNIHSIKTMFSKEKMDFNLDPKEIQTIGKMLDTYEHNTTHTTPLYYYARDDIAFVIRFIYQKPVFYKRRGTKDYQKSYKKDKDASHTPILFQTPTSFPPYRRFYKGEKQ